MIRVLLLFFGICLSIHAAAFQTNATIQTDTSAYQTQRLRINALLAERSAKFGQYDLSLNARTGIFGMQTKDDIRNSNEILRGIILSDNNIFRELKILMNYKDQEVEQAQQDAVTTNKRIEGYMLAIKRLQQQNDALKTAGGQASEKKDVSFYVIIFLCLVIIMGSGYFYSRLKKN